MSCSISFLILVCARTVCTPCVRARLNVSPKGYTKWHFLYFLPDPQGQGLFRPTFFETNSR